MHRALSITLTLLTVIPLLSEAKTTHDEQKPETMAHRLLAERTTHLGERVEIQVQKGARHWDQCHALSAFLPENSTVQWGRMTVGIRCLNAPHTRYLQALIRAFGHYWVPRENLPAGTELTAAMLKRVEGELSALPRGALRERSQIIGKIASRPLRSSKVLQRHQLKSRPLVSRRQPVTLVASGQGFHIAREGLAMDEGTQGEKVRVRLHNRKILSGYVTGPSLVDIHPPTGQ
ncbi:flagellar basal body P-ring formation chaperone FlgA [Microbulbifer elongatus]|uniref:flagellar basal body P-ring formation chaperone FlgA n=1 Tax=Microbulbifer elongatus TaxID=86173 RepID=UPI001E5F5985|nr:flagellar basal body P-ring formation chaperone FlgA [Microbulbifer elongatus]